MNRCILDSCFDEPMRIARFYPSGKIYLNFHQWFKLHQPMMSGIAIILRTYLFLTFCYLVLGFSTLPPTYSGKLAIQKSKETRRAVVVQMMGAGSLLVTYGDIWKDVSMPPANIEEHEQTQCANSPTILPRASVVRTFNGIGCAAANLWTSFFRGPTDGEVDYMFFYQTVVST
jgi:hypothetical protein